MRRVDGFGVFCLLLVLGIGTIIIAQPKTIPGKPIPPVTTEEKILGELTLIRKMMEVDREPVEIFIKDMKAGKIPPLPGVKR